MNTREKVREKEAWNLFQAKTRDPGITPDEKGIAYMEYKQAISFEAAWFENLHRWSPRFLWRGLCERVRVTLRWKYWAWVRFVGVKKIKYSNKLRMALRRAA